MNHSLRPIRFMNVATDGVSFIDEQQALYFSYLCEILSGVDAGKRASRAVLFAAIAARLCALRVEGRAVAAKITFDRNEVIRSIDSRRNRIRVEPQQVLN